MKVAQLIEYLKTMPQDAVVLGSKYCGDGRYEYEEIICPTLADFTQCPLFNGVYDRVNNWTDEETVQGVIF